MTQVKTLHLDESGSKLDYLKVTFKNGGAMLLDTDQRDGVDAVLADLESGEFDDMLNFYPLDKPADVARWNDQHPNAVTVYGE